MSGNRVSLHLVVLLLGFSIGFERSAVAAELLQYLDLPPGVLYASSSSDPDPASIQSASGDPQNPACEGDYHLLVHSGTELNGGGTYGGVQFAMPGEYLNMSTPHFYRLSFALKADQSGPPRYDVHVSNQGGAGNANTLSHTVRTDAGWLLFEHETVLTVAMQPTVPLCPNQPR